MLDNIFSEVSLAKYTSFKIGGLATTFYNVLEEKELLKLVNQVENHGLDYFILGNGSNTLFDDKEYQGLIIHFGSDFSRVKIKKNKVSCQAGLLLSQLVKILLENNLGGIEKLVGIPGSIGGALVGNAGANGVTLSDYLISVRVIENGKIKTIKKKDLLFSYRWSSLKEGKKIVISATFKFPFQDSKITKEIIKNELLIRKEKQPKFPNAGCIFKNGKDYQSAQIIDQLGLKGLTLGGARVSLEHANMIENYHNAKFDDVYQLIKIIKEKVYKEKNILLEEEIVIKKL